MLLTNRKICDIIKSQQKFNVFELYKEVIRLPYDYSKLYGLIAEKCGTQAIFAQKIGPSERSVSLKLNGKIGWKQTEIAKACEVLGISAENIPAYFFKL